MLTKPEIEERIAQLVRADDPWAFDITSSINFMSQVGFSSVYQCFVPLHINSGRPGVEHKDRCTFVAIKGNKLNMLTAPATDSLDEDWLDRKTLRGG